KNSVARARARRSKARSTAAPVDKFRVTQQLSVTAELRKNAVKFRFVRVVLNRFATPMFAQRLRFLNHSSKRCNLCNSARTRVALHDRLRLPTANHARWSRCAQSLHSARSSQLLSQ